MILLTLIFTFKMEDKLTNDYNTYYNLVSTHIIAKISGIVEGSYFC